jgi:hypothetical protein
MGANNPQNPTLSDIRSSKYSAIKRDMLELSTNKQVEADDNGKFHNVFPTFT